MGTRMEMPLTLDVVHGLARAFGCTPWTPGKRSVELKTFPTPGEGGPRTCSFCGRVVAPDEVTYDVVGTFAAGESNSGIPPFAERPTVCRDCVDTVMTLCAGTVEGKSRKAAALPSLSQKMRRIHVLVGCYGKEGLTFVPTFPELHLPSDGEDPMSYYDRAVSALTSWILTVETAGYAVVIGAGVEPYTAWNLRRLPDLSNNAYGAPLSTLALALVPSAPRAGCWVVNDVATDRSVVHYVLDPAVFKDVFALMGCYAAASALIVRGKLTRKVRSRVLADGVDVDYLEKRLGPGDKPTPGTRIPSSTSVLTLMLSAAARHESVAGMLGSLVDVPSVVYAAVAAAEVLNAALAPLRESKSSKQKKSKRR